MADIEFRILQLTEEDLKKLKQLRAYFKTLTQNKFEKIIYQAIGVAIIGYIASLLKSHLSGDDFLIGLSILTDFQFSWGLYVSLFLIAIYYMASSYKHDNRRNLALNLVEEIIDGMEKERSS